MKIVKKEIPYKVFSIIQEDGSQQIVLAISLDEAVREYVPDNKSTLYIKQLPDDSKLAKEVLASLSPTDKSPKEKLRLLIFFIIIALLAYLTYLYNVGVI